MQGDRIRRIGLQAVCLLLLSVAYVQSARAQQPVVQEGLAHNVPFEQHLVRQWTADDGLPSNYVRKIIQTRDGYIWIATRDGVARFDGHHFAVFNTARVAELPDDDIRGLYESRDGSLWIGSTTGLTRYTPGRPGVFFTIDELKGYAVGEIFEDSSGTLWLGGQRAIWSIEKGGASKIHPDAPGYVLAICEDRAGTLWFGAKDGLYRARNREFVRVNGDEDSDDAGQVALLEAGVIALHADANGGLWIGTGKGLLRYNDGKFEVCSEGLNGEAVLDILQTRSGSLYATARPSFFNGGGGRLVRWTGRSFEEVINADAACLCEDREGSLWVGATQGLVRQYRNNWTSLALQGEGVQCVLEDDGGTVWLGTTSGLRRVTDGEVTSIVDGLPHPFVRTIATGKEDALWIGTEKGLARWSDGKLTTVPGTEDLRIATVYEDSAEVVWIGLFDTGVYRLEDGSLTIVQEIKGHGSWFHEDSGGNLWIGDSFGLRRQVRNRIERVSDRNLDRLATATTAHYVDGDDLWLATITGVARYRAGRFDVFTTKEGLLAERVTNLYGDHHGNLWMGTENGFFYASLQSLDDVASGRAQKVECHWIEQEYGVSIGGDASSFPRACRTRDGTTWFAGPGPVLKVHADPIPKNLLQPQVVIEQAKVDGDVADANGPFDFLSGRHQVEVNFAVPTFFRPKRVQVKYRLNGYDDDWMDANGERVATYSNLHPGDYLFQVIAHNGDGVWNNEGDAVGFTVRPRWFETLWFRGLCLMIGLGIVISVLRWRITAVRRHHEEHQQHREELSRVARATTMGQLAASIAHEVNQPLCAILNDANSGQRLLSGEKIDVTEAKETFQDIAAAAKRASDVIAHIRELLSKHSTERVVVDVNQLIQESLHLVRPELARKGIQLEVDIEPEPSLTNVSGDHVQLQQVLINLILNASDSIDSTVDGPRVVRVRTDTRENQLEISVRDTGAGFEQDKDVDKLFKAFYTTKPDGIGMGLSISRSIVDAHGGSIRAERNNDRGATFIVTLPIYSGDADE